MIVGGEPYLIRDVEWLLRSDDAGDSMARFICTLVVEPTIGRNGSAVGES
jgi:hypothetical protein